MAISYGLTVPIAPAGNFEYESDIFLISPRLEHEQEIKTHFVSSE